MRKLFEEPEIECVRITSEVITDVPGGDLGTDSSIFPDNPDFP